MSREDLEKIFGKPDKKFGNEMCFYEKYRWGVFKDEIIFSFEEDYVVDIAITEYILWIEYRNIFYYEGQNPEYKVFNILFHESK